MKAETRTLQMVLRGDRCFQIPPYQRPYVWDREQQWEPLWQDIEATAERLGEVRQVGFQNKLDVARADKSAVPHFLGAIVVEQQATAVGEVDVRSVVDGQQRLTTLQLLLAGVLDALVAQEVTGKLIPKLRKLTRNDDDVVEGDSLFKVIPRPSDRDAFFHALSAERPGAEDSTFAAARSFFADMANAFLLDESVPQDPYAPEGTPIHGRASLLVASLLSLLKVVVIDLEDVDDAQVIFEALNARSTPLSATDLVKNLLFLRTERDKGNAEALYEQYWHRFDEQDEWWRESVGTGHAQRARQDWLVGNWLTAETGRVVNVGRLYSEFRRWMDDRSGDVESALANLGSYADAYEQMEGSREGVDPEERRAFATIRSLNIAVATPVILWLLVQEEAVLPRPERVLAMRAIESFLVRRMAARLQTRAYAKCFTEVLRAAQSASSHPGLAVVAALKAGPESYEWPTDPQLADSFRTARYYGPGGINRHRIGILLGAIDQKLQNEASKSEPLQVDYSGLTVEHVIPQKWQKHWPVVGDDEAAILRAEQLRDSRVHCIGNLTLVTGSLNPSLSNDPWAAKRLELAKHSKLQLNALLCKSEQWNEAAIEARGEWLARQMASVWPGPAATCWVVLSGEEVANIQ